MRMLNDRLLTVLARNVELALPHLKSHYLGAVASSKITLLSFGLEVLDEKANEYCISP